MANMSYCRFENTYNDLCDCYQEMDDENSLSESEKKYRKKLISLCEKVVNNYLPDEE